jgi:FkbM family methyltransferase
MIADKDILSLFIKIQDLISPDISIEIGAHDGDFSKTMVSKDIDVFAFEASPYVYDRFKDKMNGINYINKAVSDKNDVIKFEIQPDSDPSLVGNNSIKNRNEIKNYSYVEVDSVSIDNYFKNTSFSKGAIWIDAEGASREVLLGANDRINDFASIYIELESEDFWLDAWKRDDVIEYLNSKGFYLLHESPCYINQSDAIFINNKFKGLVDEFI